MPSCTYTPSVKADISMEIDSLTNGDKIKNGQFSEWEGSAILDKLISVLGKNIEIQFENRRILGSDYASAYIQMLQIASTQAMAWIQLSKELSLKQRDLDIKDSMNEVDTCSRNKQLALEKTKVDSEIKIANKKLALEEAKITSETNKINSEINRINKEIEIASKQIALAEKKTNSEVSVANRQIAGYDDNLVIKLLQAQLDAFSLIFSSGMIDLGDGDNALGPLHRNNLTETYNLLKNRVR